MKAHHLLFQLVLTIMLFLLWAAVALLVVNPYFHSDLPGYTIGRLCIWELIFLVIAAVLAKMMIKNWDYLEFTAREDRKVVSMNSKYATFFLFYFVLGILITVWQFWVFSQKF